MSANWIEYQKTITNAINTIKNETRRITDFHVNKVGKWNPNLQLLQIIEEVMEVRKDWKENNVEKEREEYVDILMAVMTLYHIEEVTDEEIKRAVTKVLNKYVERGWIKP